MNKNKITLAIFAALLPLALAARVAQADHDMIDNVPYSSVQEFTQSYQADSKLEFDPNGKDDDLDVQDGIQSNNNRNDTVLMIAIKNQDYDQINDLLDQKHGHHLNFQNRDGRTALHCAAYNNDEIVAQRLLDQGAQVNVVDHQGNSPLHIAADRNAFDVARVLLDHQADLFLENNDGLLPVQCAHNDQMRAMLAINFIA